MLIPPYCPEDSGGPISQTEAAQLLSLMQQRFAETISQKQINTKGDDLRSLDYACGSSDALHWCMGLLDRLTLDPNQTRKTALASAEFLEQQAAEIRSKFVEYE